MSDRWMLSLNRFAVSLVIGIVVWSLVIRSANAAEVTDAKLNQWLENQPTITFIALSEFRSDQL